jgi:DMSO/TMAO reductase YedYZ molybdopterin-dependent catalytic subunit
VRLSLDDLQKLPRVSNRVNHYCVEGWTAIETWTGCRFSDLARLVRAAPEARFVDFQSFDDGYHESWDIESAMHRQTVVAYALDGKILEPAHGAPARVFSPVKLGYKNTKYLTRIMFLPEMNGGYWSDMGYEWYGGV